MAEISYSMLNDADKYCFLFCYDEHCYSKLE